MWSIQNFFIFENRSGIMDNFLKYDKIIEIKKSNVILDRTICLRYYEIVADKFIPVEHVNSWIIFWKAVFI